MYINFKQRVKNVKRIVYAIKKSLNYGPQTAAGGRGKLDYEVNDLTFFSRHFRKFGKVQRENLA